MPTLRAGSAAVTTGSGTATTLIFTVPSGTQVGDTIVIWCFGNIAAHTQSATGYASLAATNTGSATCSGGVLSKTAVLGDLGGSVTVTRSGSATTWGGVIFAVGATAGFDPTPADGGQINLASTTLTVPGQTTTLNGDLIVWPAGVKSGSAGGTPATITIPAGFTTQVAQSNTTSTTVVNAGVILATATQTSAGATGNENGSVSVSQANGGMVICFGDTGGTAVSDGDTGSGAESASVAAAVSDSDAGSGTGLATLGVSGSDSAAGADSGSVSVPISGSDTGSGSSLATLGVSGSDTATGAESASVGVSGSDTGSGTGQATLGVSGSDAGAATDTGSAAHSGRTSALLVFFP